MTGAPDHPAGLMTATERDVLVDPDVDESDRNVVRERIRERLRATLIDCQVLFPTLRDADLEAVFCADDGDESSVSAIRAATQDALGVLALGMLFNGDLLETRIADALRYAGLAYGEQINTTVEVRRSPMPTPEQCLTLCATDGLTEETLLLYEHFLWDEDVTPEQAAAVGQELGVDAPMEEVEETRGTNAMDWAVRMPQTAVLDVELDRVESGGAD